MSEIQFMQEAIRKAREGIKKGQTPFGACIARKGKVVCSAHNTVWNDSDITAHAEVNAIRKACKKLNKVDLSDCVIYSTCEPCTMCYSAIHWAKIKRIFCGAGIRDAKLAGFSELEISNKKMCSLAGDGIKIKYGVLKDDCKKLFQEWSIRKDKKVY